jgi:hypothetical protein
LTLVSQVLINTSPAHAEIWAWRLDAIRRGRDDLKQARLGKALFLPGDPRRHSLLRGNERYEDHLARLTRNAFAAKGDVVDLKKWQFFHGQKEEASAFRRKPREIK